MKTKFNQFNESLIPEYDESEIKIVSRILKGLGGSKVFSPAEMDDWSERFAFLKGDFGADYEAAAQDILKTMIEDREEKFNNPTLQKVLTALKDGKLKIVRGGNKMFGKTKLSVTELVWARNYEDGYSIDVYEDGRDHVGTIEVTSSTNWKPKITEAY